MNTPHLIVMSLGPVQDFILQARRTRDLWFSSDMLSELSLEAARAVQPFDAELIFPALQRGEKAASGVPNKLLMIIRRGEPREVARTAREAARARLRDRFLKVWHSHPELVDDLSLPTALEQADTFLEFQAAWCPYTSPEAYPKALQRVEEALAERKRLRTFSPWQRQRGGRHKSSLDGARESVLRGGPREGGDWKRFRIGRREELDAIGLLKRAGGRPGQFIPVPTIGLAAYTALAKATHGPRVEALCRECERLRLTSVQPAGRRDWVRDFPFDAQVLLPGRWIPYLKEEHGLEQPEAERFGEDFVRPVLRAMGEPFPYVACLVADGDRMGPMLRELSQHGPQAHQELSRALSRFAAEARRILEEQHKGVLVYAGGDDVLGFVCLPDALACASQLSQAFRLAMERGLAGRGLKELPTLSVGLGVSHVLESLGDQLELGRHAERMAKGEDRDGFAIRARLHSGREHVWRRQWSQKPLEELEALMGLRAEGRLPLTKVREVCRAVRRIPLKGLASGDESAWRRVLVGEVRRILARVEVDSARAELSPTEARLVLSEQTSLRELHEQVDAWAEGVFLAELFLRARPGSPVAPRGEA